MTFSKPQKAKHIFKMWEASLAERDRSVASLKENFSELFYEMDKNSIDFDIAFSYLDPAISAHLPTKAVIKSTYKRYANKSSFDSEEDFYVSWKKLIKDAATNAFYCFFPLSDEEAAQLPNGMTKDEYNRQRRYAESFPLLDLSKIPDIEDQKSDLSVDDLEL